MSNLYKIYWNYIFVNKIIGVGAESKIVQITPEVLEKIRVSKLYRIEKLDLKLRKFRNKREFKILNKLYENSVNVPKPISIDEKNISFRFEFICGNVLKSCLTKKILFDAFNQIILMHNLNVVHGDLTTLNMMKKGDKIYLIDFGLSNFSLKIEDRAVDLNLFFNCIKNEHPNFYKYKIDLLSIYEKEVNKGNLVIKRLENLEMRGRNK